MFNDFVKTYNIIRNVLRDCFVYGCYSRNLIEDKQKISSRKISNEIRRIEQYVDSQYIKYDKDGRYKLLNLTYDYLRHNENFLVSTFNTKSFTKNSMLIYFYILMYLSFRLTPLSSKEIQDGLVDEGIDLANTISSKSVERKLSELCDNQGILEYKVDGKTKKYSFSKDILKDLTPTELNELFTLISGFKDLIMPVSLGHFTYQTLLNYGKYERNIIFDDLGVFNYKNLHFHPVIEEEIYFEILKAIYHSNKIEIEYKISRSEKSEITTSQLSPYKLRYDVKHGRLYLVSFSKHSNIVVSRLDRINSVKVLRGRFERDLFKDEYTRAMEHCWSSMYLTCDKKLEQIKLEVRIDEESEKYILDQLCNDMEKGELEKVSCGVYHFTFDTNDSLEILPWIRSFSGYVKVIKSKKLSKKIIDDCREVLKLYGAI